MLWIRSALEWRNWLVMVGSATPIPWKMHRSCSSTFARWHQTERVGPLADSFITFSYISESSSHLRTVGEPPPPVEHIEASSSISRTSWQALSRSKLRAFSSESWTLQ